MGLFKKAAPEPEPEAEVVAGPIPGSRYEGAWPCYREGFFYALLNDEHSREVGPDLAHPLIWRPDPDADRGGYFVFAAPDDPNHIHSYSLNVVELEVAPGADQ